VTTVEVARAVAADPSSVALVLAGPAARELWPHRPHRRVDVVGARQSALSVTVDPPRRAGVGFTAAIAVRDEDTVAATGRLTIAPDAMNGGCDLRLSLSAADDVASRVERDAARYLDEVAAVSRARSSAA
jgi:hypothetical protein